jgi:hypothetical protein
MFKKVLYTSVLTMLLLTSCNETSTLRGRVWADTNADGLQDEGEPGIPNVEVSFLVDDLLILTRLTDEKGEYFAELNWFSEPLSNLVEEDGDLKEDHRAYVQVKSPENYRFTIQNDSNYSINSDVDSSGRTPPEDELEDGMHVDAGLVQLAGTATVLDGDTSGVDLGDGIGIETPPVTTDFELELVDVIAGACDYPLPGGVGTAVLLGSENGFILQLYNPLGMGIRGDGEGGLLGEYNGPKSAGAGETAPREIAVHSTNREGEELTIPISETLFRNEYPEGCTRSYTLIYRVEDGVVLDFLSSVPYGDVTNLEIDNPDLSVGDNSLTLFGQIVNMEPGQVYYVWVEISGTELTYAMARIHPNPDGTFEVNLDLDIPTDTFIVVRVLANGRSVISTSGNSSSE